MKLISLVLNIILPGVGSFVVGRPLIGTIQLVLVVVALLLTVMSFGYALLITLPVYVCTLVWAIVTSVRATKTATGSIAEG